MYVGILNYFETGCGIRIIVKTGETIEEVKEGIDDYFLIGLTIIPMQDVIESIEKKSTEDNKKIKELMVTLEHYCPVAYKDLNKYKILDLNFEYSINLS